MTENLQIWDFFCNFVRFLGFLLKTKSMSNSINCINRATKRIFVSILLGMAFCLHTHAFTVVLDPGHGGDDPGAIGRISREKTLNLNAALQLGEMIKEAYPEVDVIYTRQTDVFIPLRVRADIANKNKADLFISIHANASDNRNASGAETFVLGTERMDDNLDIAMRENAVIKMEADYQSSYEGFDPNSIDSYIMFDLLQSDYMNQSLQFATMVQKQFVDSLNRGDRGVRQAAFLVLLRTACPSVLIEMGFISNQNEERFLASDAGRLGIARAIFRAFSQFYHPGKAIPALASDTIVLPAMPDEPVVEQIKPAKPSVIYKVQIFSTKAPIKNGDPTFKGLKNCTYKKDGVWYKYMYGECKTYEEAKKLQQTIKKKFPDCIVVAFQGDEQIPVKRAIELQQKSKVK